MSDVNFNVRVPAELLAEFKSACALRGVSMSQAVRDAMHMLVAGWEYQEPVRGDLGETESMADKIDRVMAVSDV